MEQPAAKSFFVTHSRFFVWVVAVLVLGGGAWYIFSNAAPTLGSYTVSRGDIVASADIPGTVSSSDSVDLSFQEAGQITEVYAKEGQSVAAGQALASLDDSVQQTQLSQEQAALSAAEAKLDELQNGTRPQIIAIDQNAVTSATASLAATLGNVYTSVNDAIENQTDNLFGNPKTNPDFLPNSPDNQLVINIQSERYDIVEPILDNWLAAMNAPNASSTSIVALADAGLPQIRDYLDSVATAVNGASSNNTISAAQLATLKADVSAARNEVAGAISSLTGAESALKAAQSQLALDQAGATSQDIDAQKAAVLQAQAEIDNAQLAIDHATIFAPFSGIVRNVVGQSGMVVSPDVPVLSIINNGIMKIDAYASETDVPQVRSDATTTVTLDAYGNGVIFPAKVTAVDTSETMLDGSPAYHITLYFTQPDARIRAGMTGNVIVVTAEHDNVVEVPSRLVLDDGGNDFVLVQSGGKSVRRPVTPGLTGNDGMVEIISGLNAGEKISDF
jgi:HlyD family secretion protein